MDQFRKCQNESYLFQNRNIQPWCEGLPSHSSWNEELRLCVVLYMKQCSFPSSCAMTSYHGRTSLTVWVEGRSRLQVCQWWIHCQPSLKQKSIFEADLRVVNTYCAFLCIIKQLQFEWPKLLSEETKPEDLLWVCTKYVSIPNDDDWNHQLSSAPWRSPVWTECTPWKSSWTFGTLCSTQKAHPTCYTYCTDFSSVG